MFRVIKCSNCGKALKVKELKTYYRSINIICEKCECGNEEELSLEFSGLHESMMNNTKYEYKYE